MRIWFDILTPKQVNFFKPMVDALRKEHEVLCTSRAFRETIGLSKIRGLDIKVIGNYGLTLYDKLLISARRMERLARIVKDYSPDLLVTFSSPDACRVAFGLKIPILCFNDSPHAEAVCKLSLPLVDKLMHPWVIPSSTFIKYGIEYNKIISYKALDPSIWIKNINIKYNNRRDLIIFRIEESKASYIYNDEVYKDVLDKLIDTNYKIVVLARYNDQINYIKSRYNNKIIVMERVIDALQLLTRCKLFIGSGGTMSAEAALLGIPNIIYNMHDNYVSKFLIEEGLSYPLYKANDIKELIPKVLNMDIKSKSQDILSSMEDIKSIAIKEILSFKKN